MKKDEIKELTDAFIAKTQEMEYPKKNPEDPFRQYWNGVSDAVEVMLETLKEMTDNWIERGCGEKLDDLEHGGNDDYELQEEIGGNDEV